MKRLTLSLIFFLTFNLILIQLSYSQTSQSAGSATQYSTSTFAQTSTNAEIEASLDRALYFGFQIGFGLSKQNSGAYEFSNTKPKFSYSFSVTGLYYFMKEFAIRFELGNHFLRSRDINEIDAGGNGNYSNYDLQYLFVSIAPMIQFKRIYFYFGIYFGFIMKAQFDSNNNQDSKLSMYTLPDIGLLFGIGYMFKVSEKVNISAGIELKNQLNTFRIYNLAGGKIFAATITTSVLIKI